MHPRIAAFYWQCSSFVSRPWQEIGVATDPCIHPKARGCLGNVLHQIVVGDAGAESLAAARSMVEHPADARFLAAAMEATIEYFVTLDRRHFLDKERLASESAFQIGTPGECLGWLRRRLRRSADVPPSE